ncbi:MAG: LTA synthase family protein [Clostridiales bacterium]|nr:LTA synthase family protein [Clostridiales bacterium]
MLFSKLQTWLRSYTPAQRRLAALLWGVLLLTPLTAFYLMQFVFGGLPWEYSPGVLLGNYLCIGAGFFLLSAVTGRILLSSLFIHLLCLGWGAANYFVNLYRGLPILPWDFTALNTALAVADSYDLYLTGQMIASLAAILSLGLLIRRQVKALGGGSRPGRRTRLLCLTAALICCIPVIRVNTLGRFGIQTDVWDQAGSYRSGGLLAVFLRNFQFLSVEEPADYSPEHLEEILAGMDAEPEPYSAPERPNIIAIMNESWADFEEFGNLQLSESVTDTIRSTGARFGHAYASVFGAGTSASEFEFLTGNSMAFLPSGSIPYQQYVTPGSLSLASVLSEYGYDCLAIHPGERSSWQRDLAYPKLGFDEFKCMEDLDLVPTWEHGYISDDSSFRQILHEFEEKEPGEPLFLFNVTIQNHGSYTVEDYPAEVTLTDRPGEFPKAEQYLTLANKTDEAFRLLTDYFSQYDEPTIILMFGDHQPSLEEEFLDLACGLTGDGMTMEEYLRKYRVPYLIWANYDLPEQDLPETSLNFLAPLLLRYAGLEGTGYGRFLWGVQQEVPILTFAGYFGADGEAYSHLEQNAYTPLIEEYRAFQYSNLFGGAQRADALFALPAREETAEDESRSTPEQAGE